MFHRSGSRLLRNILLVALIIWIALLSRNTQRQYHTIGIAPDAPRTVAFTGNGKVSLTPTLATVTLGVQTDGGMTITTTQSENAKKMQAVSDGLKKLGIAAKDIQTTSYSVMPRYDYSNGRQALLGYTVAQQVTAKIRDLAKVGDVLSMAGAVGANQMSGPDFTVEDPQALKAEARAKAIDDAKQKASVLAGQLGVHLGRITAFSESDATQTPYPMMFDKAMGVGGGATEVAPPITPGTMEVLAAVTVSYEIE